MAGILRMDPEASPGESISNSFLRPLLPALLIGLLALWSGTFSGAATSAGAAATQIAILGFCVLGYREWRDPLRLGNSGRWLVPVLLVATGLSWWMSPVPRAGRTALVLLPAFILIPAAVAFCWSGERLLRRGQTAMSLVVLIVAGLAIASRLYLESPRAALPLGHHTLVAGWLVLLLPLVVEPGYRSRKRRFLAVATGAVGLLALALTGSLLGGLVVVVQFVIAVVWWRLPRWLLAFPVLVLAFVVLPRLGTLATGMDASARTREVYLRAGMEGVEQRPILGWGPGSTPWTIAEFTKPIPNLNPSSEIIGDLHSLPVQIGYETGVLGLALSGFLVILFIATRLSSVRQEQGPSRKSAILGFLGGVLFSLGAAPLAVPALPATVAVVAGATLPLRPRARDGVGTIGLLPVAIYLLLALVLLLPPGVAHSLYDIARIDSEPSAAIEHLESAVALDPEFPLYRARLAWLTADGSTGRSAAEALRAAEQARSLAPLWLQAGYLGSQAETAWAPDAFETALRLDPLSSLAAFHCMTSHASTPQAIDWGSRALSAEPSFAKARFWRQHRALAESIDRRTGLRPETWPIDDQSRIVAMTMVLDKVPSLSFSLYAFRRSPWPGNLAPVELVMPPGTRP